MTLQDECDHFRIFFNEFLNIAECMDCHTEWKEFSLTLTKRMERKSK